MATQITAYLAGPDVFLPDALAHARRKVAICARYGIMGRPPLNEDVASLRAMPSEAAWWAIFRKDLAMMEACDILIANLTPSAAPRPMPTRWSSSAGSSAAAGPSSATRTPPALCRAQSDPGRGGARPAPGPSRRGLRAGGQPDDRGRGAATGGTAARCWCRTMAGTAPSTPLTSSSAV
ncbi:MAG TPA: nucleoside 2-deoxyribosyltransferase [Acetobacteraceae bacterium]|nr:nucleoside 2-deoxyribosyltransferase [Acetobacteraceae bacterium]